MSYKFPAALASGLAVLAVAAPVASATITAAPLTISQSGDTTSFTIAAPGDAQGADRLIGLFVAPAGTGTTTLATTIMQGVGYGAARVTGSTVDCQVVNGANATPLEVVEPEYSDAAGFTWKIPTSQLPASFDAKAVIADDPEHDTCQPDEYNFGIATTMADATRWPIPVTVPPIVVTVPVPVPTPAPAPAPAPAPTPTKPAADPDKDGIKNDWLVGGKPVAAPSAPKVSGVTAHGAQLKLPKAPKGGTIRVYVRVAGKGTFKAVTVKVNKKTGKAAVSGLKSGSKYEVKVVAVNKAGKQTAASKAVVVKTAKG